MDNAPQILSRLAARWRAEAAVLQRRGAPIQAGVLESCASEMEQEAQLFSLETLDLEQAVAESGYSYSTLQKMLSDGTIPNAGKKGTPRVRRCDLPKKPGSGHQSSKGESDLADLVLAETP